MTSSDQEFLNNSIRQKLVSDVKEDDTRNSDRISKLSPYDYNKFNRLCKLVTQFIKSRSDFDIRDFTNRVGYEFVYSESSKESIFQDLQEICELFNYLSGEAKSLFIRRMCLLLSSYHYIGYHARVRCQRRMNQFLEMLRIFDKQILNQLDLSDGFVQSSCVPMPVLNILPPQQQQQDTKVSVKEVRDESEMDQQ